MRTFLGSLALAGAALIVATGVASAAFSVSELAISSSSDTSGAATNFPAGTRSVNVVFAYKGASGEKVSVKLEAPNLPNLYESPAKVYRGDGADAVAIAGTDIYRRLGATLVDATEVIKDDLGLIQSQNLVQDYFSQIQASASAALAAANMIESVKDALPAEQVQQNQELSSVLEELSRLAVEAQKLPISDLDGKRAVASRMQTPAQTALGAAQALSAHADKATGIPLPTTATAGDGYTVQVHIGGSLHRDTAFGVSGTGSPGGGSNTVVGSATTAAGTGAPPTTTSGTRTTTDRGTVGGSSAGGSSTSGSGAGPSGGSLTPGSGGASSTIAGVRSTSPAAAGAPQPGSPPLGAPTMVASGAAYATPVSAAQEGAQSAPGAQSALAQPTWTLPPAGSAAEQPVSPGQAPSGSESGQGPNIAILAIGAVGLAIVAFWLRQRM